VSIRTLARELDLSITTVSRALAGYSDVSKATQERVKAAAKAIGYRPNASARSLKMGRANAMGLVLPSSAAQGDAFLSELIAGVSAALARQDLDLVVTTTRSDEREINDIRRVADARKVDGFILPRTRWDDPRVDLLIEMNIPFVCHGRTSRAAEHAWLDIDGEAAFTEAMARLVSFGHKNIALINAPKTFTFARHRAAGYRKGLAAAGLTGKDHWQLEAPSATIEHGMALAVQLMSGADRPTAILCATDQLAIGAIKALKDVGLQPGRDVSVIGYDDIMIASHIEPPLTTMRQAISKEAEQLVALLMGRMSGKPVSDLQCLWRAELIARASDGPCKSD
jgi:LacI family transcriptional regulator